MKLKAGFVTQEIEGTQFMIPLIREGAKSIVRSNSTAAFIVDCLKEETSEEAIVDKVCDFYAAPRDIIAADVQNILDTLRGFGVLDEA